MELRGHIVDMVLEEDGTTTMIFEDENGREHRFYKVEIVDETRTYHGNIRHEPVNFIGRTLDDDT